MDCTVCGARSRRKLWKDGVEILECSECGLAHWEPEEGFRPQDIYDAAYFEAGGSGPGYDDYAHQERGLRQTFARRLAHLPRPEHGARMLDVGAAYGFAVSEARSAGWQALGLERSHAAARRARRPAPRRVLAGDALFLPFSDHSFDLVSLWDVIVHPPTPPQALAEIARGLRPGGILLIVDMVGHRRQEYRQTMGHRHLGFDESATKKWAKSGNLSLTRYHRLPPDPSGKGPSLFAATLTKP